MPVLQLEREPRVCEARVRPEAKSGLLCWLVASSAAGLHYLQDRQSDPECEHQNGDLPVG